ncbi:MAG: class I SAM-dependent methyltransferase [Actinomycetota bacterium]|nr:class I SAM-dependent methyltransferase [Actinomycetota bacterium]
MPEIGSEYERLTKAAEAFWYHTIDLGDGIVTRGFFDLRPMLPKLPIPERLDGLRCLDVGTADGFFAFEMAKRGAAEVVATDLADARQRDWPPRAINAKTVADDGSRARFELARSRSGLDVTWVDSNVYRIHEQGLGQFDFVVMGNILLHLRDPIAALASVRGVVAGHLLSLEPISPSLTLLFPRTPTARFQGIAEPYWWTLNVTGHRHAINAAGFHLDDPGSMIRMPFGEGAAEAVYGGTAFWSRGYHRARYRFGHPCTWALASADEQCALN